MSLLARLKSAVKRVGGGAFATRGDPVNLMRRDNSPEAIRADVDYGVQIISGFESWSQGAGFDIKGKRVLEIGPGINLAGAMGLKALGAAEVAVSDRWLPPWQDDYNPAFCRAMATRVRAEKPLWDASVFERVAAGGYAGVVQAIESPAEKLAEKLGTALAPVDAIFSNAVLEHMADHAATARALFAVTRPGGIGFHQVDFRDHRDFTRPLEYMLWSPDEYLRQARACDHIFGCQLRPHELAKLFEGAGFKVNCQPGEEATEPYWSDFLARLKASPSGYRDMAPELVRVIGAFYVLRK